MSQTSDEKEEDAAISLQRRVDEVCLRFEKAWQAEQRPVLEDYLGDTLEPERAVLCRELIAVEVAYRSRTGEIPRKEEYEARFPCLDLTELVDLSAAPADGSAKSLLCPHCHHPTQLVDYGSDKAVCSGCGGSFRVREARQVTTPSPMRSLGKFQLLERVGLGAFGSVWRARDTTLDKIVALKIPHTGLLTEEEELERFRREARAAAQLRHPGIVTVHEFVTLNGLPTIVADFIEGVSLKVLLEAGTLAHFAGFLGTSRQRYGKFREGDASRTA